LTRHIAGRRLSRGLLVARRHAQHVTHTAHRPPATGRTRVEVQRCSCCLCMNIAALTCSNATRHMQ